MKTLYLAHWHKETLITANDDVCFRYPAGSISMLSYASDNLEQVMQQRGATVYPVDEIIKPWKYGDKKPTKLFVFMVNYGIGDHLAFSGVARWMQEHTGIRLQMYMLQKEYAVYDYFRTQNFDLNNGTGVILPNYSLASRFGYKNFKRLRMEFAASNARVQNWYDSMFERIGVTDVPREYCRPQLRQLDRYLEKKTILINHKASCQIRTSRFEDFYFPVKEVFPDWQILVSSYDLSDDDKAFIDKHPDVRVINIRSASHFLEWLERVAFVVCTDSAAIHFREGICMPALAVYSAFTTESHVRDYIYTRSINIRSNCDLAPCFQHGNYCTRHDGKEYATCISGLMFQQQLAEGLRLFL